MTWPRKDIIWATDECYQVHEHTHDKNCGQPCTGDNTCNKQQSVDTGNAQPGQIRSGELPRHDPSPQGPVIERSVKVLKHLALVLVPFWYHTMKSVGREKYQHGSQRKSYISRVSYRDMATEIAGFVLGSLPSLSFSARLMVFEAFCDRRTGVQAIERMTYPLGSPW